MKNFFFDTITISKEIIKNLLMSSSLFRSFRNRMASGRTTGSLDTDAAVHYCTQIMDHYKKGLLDAGLAPDYFENKNILEIGPGANLSVQLSFVLEGASRAYAIDRFSDLRRTPKEAEVYKKIISQSHIKRQISPETFYQVKDQLPVFVGEKIKYFGNCKLENAGSLFSREFDVVVAHLVLECIADLSQGMSAIAKIIKPGGICIFRCNPKSFGISNPENAPLKFLNYSDKIWNWMFSNRGGANRIRSNEYLKLLQKNDFKILSFVVLDSLSSAELNKAKPFLSKRFKKLSDDELSIIEFRIVAQYQA